MANEVMDAKQVAHLFNKSVSTIYNWRDKGIIKPIFYSPSGRGELYDKDEIMSLYTSHHRGQPNQG